MATSLEIGIVGCGVIGGALRQWLAKNTPHHVLRIHDPPLGMQDDLTGVKVLFICIPVPTNLDKSQNLGDLRCLLENFKLFHPQTPIFIRSTVLPGTCRDLSNTYYPLQIFPMPEFLTQRRALEDFEKHPLVIGAESRLDKKVDPPIQDLLAQIFPGKPLLWMKREEAEMAKYVHNVFGALKVGYFNLVHELCTRMWVRYEKVLQGARITGFIEPTHTQVPGPDGQFGFGGGCLPKDLSAFVRYCYENGVYGAGTLSSLESDNFYYRSKSCSRQKARPA